MPHMSRHSFDPEIAATRWPERGGHLSRTSPSGSRRTEPTAGTFSRRALLDLQCDLGLWRVVPLSEREADPHGARKAGQLQSLIIKGNFSDDRYDRTCWYALGNSICPNGQIDPTERENDAFAPEGKPSAPEGKSYKNRYKPYQKPYPSHAKEAAVEDEIF